MNESKYCFFIVSCVKNIEIVNLQIQTIKQFCKTPVQIYISFDDEIPLASDNVKYLSGSSLDSFGIRVAKAVESIPYQYIIVMCDDFIVESEINLEELEFLVENFFIDKNISAITLVNVNGKNENKNLPYSHYGDKYIKRERLSKYKTTFQCSLWNKNAFANLVKNAKNPWEFEIFTNQQTYLVKNDFYALQKGERAPIDYNRGCFVIRGKIVKAEKERLEVKLNRKINIQGFEYTDSYLQYDSGLVFRLKRRLKLFRREIMYRFLSLFIKKDINEI